MGSPGGGGNTEIASFLILHVGIIIMPLLNPPSAASTGKNPAVPPPAALPSGKMELCPLAPWASLFHPHTVGTSSQAPAVAQAELWS